MGYIVAAAHLQLVFSLHCFAVLCFLHKPTFLHRRTGCSGAATICPRPSPPSVGAEDPRAAEPTAPDRNVAVSSLGKYVPTLTAAAA